MIAVYAAPLPRDTDAWVRACLCHYLQTDLLAPILRGEHGKPYLADHRAAFNLSHSGDWAVCAVGACAVGIDLERLRDFPRYRRVAKRYFSPSEKEPPDLATFFRLWVEKEAYMKLCGRGLPFGMDTVVSERCHLAAIPIADGYDCALATASAQEWSVLYEDFGDRL